MKYIFTAPTRMALMVSLALIADLPSVIISDEASSELTPAHTTSDERGGRIYALNVPRHPLRCPF
jgi:hypothetical protein